MNEQQGGRVESMNGWERVGRARVVAAYWRDEMMANDESCWAAHPLAMVLAALGGETDPRELGISENPRGVEARHSLEGFAPGQREAM